MPTMPDGFRDRTHGGIVGYKQPVISWSVVERVMKKRDLWDTLVSPIGLT
ncbi:MAG: hypothetical protein ACYDAG_08480 [Chloroflexota bacterium]